MFFVKEFLRGKLSVYLMTNMYMVLVYGTYVYGTCVYGTYMSYGTTRVHDICLYQIVTQGSPVRLYL